MVQGNGDSDGDGFKQIVVVEANEKGDWRLNFSIDVPHLNYLLDQIKANIMAGKVRFNPAPSIVKPSPEEVRKIES